MDNTVLKVGWPPPPPIPNSWWVPGELLCGPYPGHQIPDTATARLNALLDANVRLVVSLMEEGERNREGLLFTPYWPRLLDLANERGVAIFHGQFPVPDLGIPTVVQVREILAAVRDTATAGGVTYVHCFGGHGRSAKLQETPSD